MAADRVDISHPETKLKSNVTADAFERAWKLRGWEKVSENLGSLKKDELVEKAAAAGVDTSGTKDDIIDRLETQEN